MIKNIAILGATGSIGTSALDVIAKHPDRFAIWGLTSHSRIDNCCAMIEKFQPKMVAVSAAMTGDVANFLASGFGSVTLLEGEQGINAIAAAEEVDIVIAGIAGAAGFASTLSAIRAGKKVLIANKEPLVMLGEMLRKLVADSGAQIIPIDSEHNAIFQCLPKAAQIDCMSGEIDADHGLLRHGVQGITLTASGGPFLNTPPERMSDITPDQAAAHPRWTMGRKISIDSATMMNKGLEMIEACALFGVSPQNVEVVIHPESIVHSFVEYLDGSILAQLASPDMRVPIAAALGDCERIDSGAERLDLVRVGQLNFQKPDDRKFPCLVLARQVAETGGAAPVVLNAANEVAVNAFCAGRLRFTDIPDLIHCALEDFSNLAVDDVESIIRLDQQVRDILKNKLDTSANSSQQTAAEC